VRGVTDLLLFSTQIGEGKEARKEARVLFEVVCNVGLHFFLTQDSRWEEEEVK